MIAPRVVRSLQMVLDGPMFAMNEVEVSPDIRLSDALERRESILICSTWPAGLTTESPRSRADEEMTIAGGSCIVVTTSTPRGHCRLRYRSLHIYVSHNRAALKDDGLHKWARNLLTRFDEALEALIALSNAIARAVDATATATE